MKHLHLHTFILLFLTLFVSHSAKAQLNEGGIPPSFAYSNQLRSQVEVTQIPVNFCIEDLKQVDAWKVSNGAPLATAKIIPTDLNIRNSGTWTTLPDSTKVWQLHIQAKGAIALMLYYNAFSIPEGGKLFIYNPDKSQVAGAFTHHTNPTTTRYATEFIAGDELILEYVLPASGALPDLSISDVGYGYDHLTVVESQSQLRLTGSNTSGTCNVNVNCSEGDEWQNQQKGVCYIQQRIGDYIYLCTGSLVNNTARDQKPYVLSAFHCFQDDASSSLVPDSILTQTLFYFHYSLSGCESTSTPSKPKVLTGCRRIAYSPIQDGSDGMLLLLNHTIPSTYDVYYNGWDRAAFSAVSGVGIHHPAGDYMKISTFGEMVPYPANWINTDNKDTTIANADLIVTFDQTKHGHGVTEGGSSGSPLFNQNGLIIGTLSGGGSSCEEPNGINIYGKFSYHWDVYGNSDSTQFKNWLDPIQSNPTYLLGMNQSGYSTAQLKAPASISAATPTTTKAVITWTAPLFSKPIVHGNNSCYYQFNNEGEPFYYGQRWKASDLTKLALKTITHLMVYTSDSATYSMLIAQGSRTYKQAIPSKLPEALNSVKLTTPFVIDTLNDLILSLYVTNYKKNFYPAYADDGPSLYGQGNILSSDGVTWDTCDTTDFDVNFPIGAIVSSQSGVITKSSLLSTQPVSFSNEKSAMPLLVARPLSKRSLKLIESNLESFPEVSGYQVYRDDVLLTSVPSSTLTYTDENVLSGSHIYKVTALYDTDEGLPATVTVSGPVANESISLTTPSLYPIPFEDFIRLSSPESVSSIEAYNSEGKLMLSLKNPTSVIQTSSFNSGVYIFRLHTANGIQTIKAVRK